VLSPLVFSIFPFDPTNHNSFCFETNPNLASKRSVEVMWQDENSLEAASFMPEDSPPSKSRKGSLASSILQSAGNSSVLVEHRCGTKKIDMVFDDNEAILPSPDLLIDKLPAEKPSAPALSLFHIRRIQFPTMPDVLILRVAAEGSSGFVLAIFVG
jgi:hypothetical protein